MRRDMPSERRVQDREIAGSPPTGGSVFIRAKIASESASESRLDPGGSASAVFQRWDNNAEDWRDGDRYHTIHDADDETGARNFALPGEVVNVRYNARTQRFECFGSFGLFRKGTVTATSPIEKDSSGEVTIWSGGEITSPAQTITAWHDWGSEGALAEDAEVYVRYFPDQQKWIILAADNAGVQIGKLDATLSQGSYANATRWQRNSGDTAWEATSPTVTDVVYDWLLPASESVSSGKKVIYSRHSQSGKWLVVAAEC